MQESKESKWNEYRKLSLYLHDRLGPDHPETIKAICLSLEYAPEEIQEEVRAMAKSMGLIPEKSVGFNEKGEELYALKDIAECAGMSMKEAERAMNDLLAVRKEAGLETEIIQLGYDGSGALH